MQKKGQFFSLDFLLAMGLMVLAMGIVIKFSEQTVFDWQEKQQQTQLENSAKTAVLLLLSNPKLTCEITAADGTPLGIHVNNCIDARSPNFTQTTLGLPPELQFDIYNQNTDTTLASTGTPNPDTPAVFKTTINAVVSNGPILKASLYHCLQQKSNCDLIQQTIQVTVWK